MQRTFATHTAGALLAQPSASKRQSSLSDTIVLTSPILDGLATIIILPLTPLCSRSKDPNTFVIVHNHYNSEMRSGFITAWTLHHSWTCLFNFAPSVNPGRFCLKIEHKINISFLISGYLKTRQLGRV